jgi:predicted membrane protein DUF2157
LAAHWERYLKRWTTAGLIEPSTAERVRVYEAQQQKTQGLRWPVALAISLGGLLLGAGVLLFVAAHWDMLSPGARFGLVLLLVAIFHVAGAFAAGRFSVLSTTLHAVGTISLGAGIFLAGQIFNLQEHWPAGLLLWALGAWVAYVLLQDWPQAALAALLTPMWLGGEWLVTTGRWVWTDKTLAEGILLLAITYLTALLPGRETPVRTTLAWIGALALIPSVLFVIVSGTHSDGRLFSSSGISRELGWTVALLLPLALAWVLRRSAAWMNLIAALWVVALGSTSLPSQPNESLLRFIWRELGPYALCALGSMGLIAWGLKEARKERINLGVAGFALTVLVFYFSNVMDKLGRSASLIGLGLLFLLGGWLLERTRRRLVARLERTDS